LPASSEKAWQGLCRRAGPAIAARIRRRVRAGLAGFLQDESPHSPEKSGISALAPLARSLLAFSPQRRRKTGTWGV